MQLSHRPAAVSSAFDDPNLVSAAGLFRPWAWPRPRVSGRWLMSTFTCRTISGANAGLKVSALVAGMLAGAACIDDMGILRHGGMGKLFKGTHAPWTLGSFLRHFTFGHVRQLDAAAGRWLVNLAAAAPIIAGIDELALVDIDDTIKAAYGYQKQGAGFGYSGV